MVTVVVNGKPVDVASGMTIADLVRMRGLNPDTIIVEHNRNLVKKGAWDQVALKEDDCLEILRFVGGG